jgi:hypothetical protein
VYAGGHGFRMWIATVFASIRAKTGLRDKSLISNSLQKSPWELIVTLQIPENDRKCPFPDTQASCSVMQFLPILKKEIANRGHCHNYLCNHKYR